MNTVERNTTTKNIIKLTVALIPILSLLAPVLSFIGFTIVFSVDLGEFYFYSIPTSLIDFRLDGLITFSIINLMLAYLSLIVIGIALLAAVTIREIKPTKAPWKLGVKIMEYLIRLGIPLYFSLRVLPGNLKPGDAEAYGLAVCFLFLMMLAMDVLVEQASRDSPNASVRQMVTKYLHPTTYYGHVILGYYVSFLTNSFCWGYSSAQKRELYFTPDNGKSLIITINENRAILADSSHIGDTFFILYKEQLAGKKLMLIKIIRTIKN